VSTFFSVRSLGFQVSAKHCHFLEVCELCDHWEKMILTVQLLFDKLSHTFYFVFHLTRNFLKHTVASMIQCFHAVIQFEILVLFLTLGYRSQIILSQLLTPYSKSLGFVLRNGKEFSDVETLKLLYFTYGRSRLEMLL
jgi:hypothetical protein